MVRLVFRPYTQVRRSICTSESLRTSTRVSSGFVLLRNSSPSFGSQRIRSVSAPSQATETGPCCMQGRKAQALACQPSDRAFTFITPMGFQHPMTRAYVKLLGPCFKTGRRDDQLLHREQTREHAPNHRFTTKHRMRYPCSDTKTEHNVRRPYPTTSRANSRHHDKVPPKGRPLVRGSSSCSTSLSANTHKCTSTHHRSYHPALLTTEQQVTTSPRLNAGEFASSIRFHPTGFTSSLTLSSKCFSTFPHGTCSLSVS